MSVSMFPDPIPISPMCSPMGKKRVRFVEVLAPGTENERKLFSCFDSTKDKVECEMQYSLVPKIHIHPPADDGEEACLSYNPCDELCPLPNTHKLRSLSLAHAALQILMALPETTEELPIASTNQNTNLIASIIRRIHANDIPDLAPLVAAINPDSNTSDNSIASVANYETVMRALVSNCLAASRLGKRFHLETTTNPSTESLEKLYNETFSSLPSLSIESSPSSESNTLNNSLNALNPVSAKDLAISLPLADYAEHQSLNLLTLLRKYFGIPEPPQFFFGGASMYGRARTPSPDKSLDNSQQQQRLLTRLPSLLTVVFQRPLVAQDSVFHRTSVELPMEFDLGFAVSPDLIAESHKNHHHSKLNTYFKLHGFVTQTEGRFIAYTRVRGDPFAEGFWKCEDETVTGPTDLGARVNSKGVVIALYRAQAKSK